MLTKEFKADSLYVKVYDTRKNMGVAAAADISLASFAFSFFSGLIISTTVSIAVLNNSADRTTTIVRYY